MTPQRRLEIEQHANLYGSANCWAGTSGTLATMIRELLAEIDQLESQAEVMTTMMRDLMAEIDRLKSERANDDVAIRRAFEDPTFK